MNSELRIEFNERFLDDLPSDEEIDTLKNLKQPIPEGKVKFRRIYPRLLEIDYPREIPGMKKHCEILFLDGTSVIVCGSYDEIALLIDERAKLLDQKGE
jgi:hypothetical protein